MPDLDNNSTFKDRLANNVLRHQINDLRVDTKNVHNVKLDTGLGSMYSVGPVFEGMPMMRFGNNRIDWTYLSQQLANMYAPKIPF